MQVQRDTLIPVLFRRALFATFLGLVLCAGPSPLRSAPLGARPAPKPKPKPKLDPTKKPEALKHLRAGLAFYNAGEYPKAIVEYKKAYALYPSPKLYPNIGSCYKYMGRNLKAIIYYEKFLAESEMDSADATTVKLRRMCRLEIKALKKLIGRLRVIVKVPGALVKVAGFAALHSPLDKQFRFNPGRINILVKKKGFYAFDRTVVIKAATDQVVKVLLLKKIKPKVVIRIKPATPLYKRWWFWTAIGSLVAGGVTAAAVVLGSRTDVKNLSGDQRLNHNSFNVRF